MLGCRVEHIYRANSVSVSHGQARSSPWEKASRIWANVLDAVSELAECAATGYLVCVQFPSFDFESLMLSYLVFLSFTSQLPKGNILTRNFDLQIRYLVAWNPIILLAIRLVLMASGS